MRLRKLCSLLILVAVGCNGTAHVRGETYHYDRATHKYLTSEQESAKRRAGLKRAARIAAAPTVAASYVPSLNMGTMRFGN